MAHPKNQNLFFYMAVIVMSVLVFFTASFSFNRKDSVKNELEKTYKMLKEYVDIKANAAVYEKEYKRLRKIFDNRVSLLDVADDEKVIFDMCMQKIDEALSKRKNIQLVSKEKQDSLLAIEDVYKTKVNLRIKTDAESLTDFIYYLQAKEESFVIDEIEINPEKKDLLECYIGLYVLYKKG